MHSWKVFGSRRIPALAIILIVIIFLFFANFRFFFYSDQFRPFNSIPSEPSKTPKPSPDEEHHDKNGASQSYTLDLPPEYNYTPEIPSFCAQRFSRTYLTDLRDSATGYCTQDSPFNITCFHSQTTASRIDSFCFGRSAAFNIGSKTFHLQCNLRDRTRDEIEHRIPELQSLASYWYGTGPRVVIEDFIDLDPTTTPPPVANNYTVLVKREGAYNPWHSLMEIFSMMMTLDVLRITPELPDGAPLLTEHDTTNTQVVILDDHEDGPYFDLWTIFAKRPILRLNDIPNGTTFENVIIPLAGASNPMWQGDWEPHPCPTSDLLQVFSRRTIDFYGISPQSTEESPDIVITFIDRKESRRLIDQEAYLDGIRQQFQHVTVRAVDFASISFREQLQIVRTTDVLVGVHGAGLTHALFLKPNSVVVEILPAGLNHKGFRNLAGLLGHTYYSAHSRDASTAKRDDWHYKDVELEKDRFMTLIEVAVKSLYNSGPRNYDTV
ncbi:hypothetical protein DTO021D3_1686 [Paecilomyces variotii]|nr:hypothetical protein DTO032I3_1538 [Paecilomyces variotii]KAJ9226418.1 hypothetical protein DTO169C6_1146 [Paecilomyces variotii]KAJ9281463.1 hypothetical protein DTO021D3_1686 [Paecilomyces variotii]KAJ9346722.1 hypothetical protein DTO027B6_976 [Paecilomyces variotii]KAJ9360103.1 hypothetical protein DTO027B9_1655 [Paecilomyces variotii]